MIGAFVKYFIHVSGHKMKIYFALGKLRQHVCLSDCFKDPSVVDFYQVYTSHIMTKQGSTSYHIQLSVKKTRQALELINVTLIYPLCILPG